MAREGRTKRVRRRGLEEKRAQVVRLIERGTHPEDVAAAFEVGRSMVYGWWAAYRAKGEDSFKVGRSSGRPPKLSPREVDALRKLIVGKDPRQLHFDFALWTRDMVRTLIAERFGVEMSRQGVSNLLKRMGLSPQRPLVGAYGKDSEAVERWRTEEYPKIAAAATDARAQVFFCDEAGVRTDHHAGRAWGEVGMTPVIRGTGQRRGLNMISAVSPKGKLHFSFAGRVSSDSFIEYLKLLLHDVPGKIFGSSGMDVGDSATMTREFSLQGIGFGVGG